jgi:hypothetical protein
LFISIFSLAVLLHTLPLLFYGQFFDENTMTAVLNIRQSLPLGHPIVDPLTPVTEPYSEPGIIWLGIYAYKAFGRLSH